MSLKRLSYKDKFGKPPGTIDYTGIHRSEPIEFELVRYGHEGTEIIPLANIDEFDAHFKEGANHWIRVFGLHDADSLRAVGTKFDISDLVLEDIANVRHSPKREISGDQALFIVKLFRIDEKDELATENLSIFYDKQVLITFSERRESPFGPLQERLQIPRSRILDRGLDYLLFALLDLIVDYTILIIDSYAEDIDVLEAEASRDRKGKVVENIIQYKREIVMILRFFAPLKAMTEDHSEWNKFISEENKSFFKDLHGMVGSNISQLEFLRDTLDDLVDIHSSLMDHRMNRIIYTLTLISAIFIPLTFIAGVYGMNFDYMPELHEPNAYYYALGAMGVIAIGMLLYMKRKNWF